jgi:glycosyltransferase involved in cell wall biosynthesis
MRIGIDARFWNETGVGRYIRNLVAQLSVIDTENSYVLFMREADRELFKPEKSRWTVVSTDIHWHSLSEQLHFPQILDRQNLDVMHFPYFSIPIRYSRPYIVTIHDLILHHFATGEATTLPFHLYKIKLAAYKFIMNRAAANARKLIAVSHATAAEIHDHLHIESSKVSVIYEGVDSAINHQPSTINPDSIGVNHQRYGKYFLHVGNVYPHKNAKRLIEGFDQADIEGYKLLFVGKKDYFMEQLEKFVRHSGLEKKVMFLGFVSDMDLGSLYQNSAATVVPSLMEGFGLPVLEAMVNNSLVLASDIPSLREIAGDGAIYANPFDVHDISAKIRYMAEGDRAKLASCKKRGLQIAKEFSWRKMARETLAVYESSISI